MDTSIFLAQVMGLFLVVYCAAILININNMTSVISGLFHNAAMQFIVGMILLIVGSLLVVSHNIWESSWVVLVTILSWIVFLKGVLYIAFPKMLHKMSKPFLNNHAWIYIGASINLVVGLYLCYVGFY